MKLSMIFVTIPTHENLFIYLMCNLAFCSNEVDYYNLSKVVQWVKNHFRLNFHKAYMIIHGAIGIFVIIFRRVILFILYNIYCTL